MTANTLLPLDIDGMRATSAGLLAPDADTLPVGEVETLTLRLKGHLAVIIPDLGRAASTRRGDDDIPRLCARTAISETCRKVRAKQYADPSGRLAYARRLARALNALCDHYEELSAPRPAVTEPPCGCSCHAESAVTP